MDPSARLARSTTKPIAARQADRLNLNHCFLLSTRSAFDQRCQVKRNRNPVPGVDGDRCRGEIDDFFFRELRTQRLEGFIRHMSLRHWRDRLDAAERHASRAL
jgi:hypothetical protein